MVTRTLIQKKVFDIYCQSEYLCGHGDSWTLKRIEFIKEQEWINDDNCNELLKHCIRKWEKMKTEAPHTTTNYKPELSIYWQTIEIK